MVGCGKNQIGCTEMSRVQAVNDKTSQTLRSAIEGKEKREKRRVRCKPRGVFGDLARVVLGVLSQNSGGKRRSTSVLSGGHAHDQGTPAPCCVLARSTITRAGASARNITRRKASRYEVRGERGSTREHKKRNMGSVPNEYLRFGVGCVGY